ncbi:60S ribosome subunit biogenesis protein NIP7 like [Verticillium longisporum]|nr:60S ribosome subunit biogenesis protein NIP7 like [Verticillium longisporum]
MRPLVEEETKKVFAKLANYTGGSLKQLIQPLDNGNPAYSLCAVLGSSTNAPHQGDRYVLRLQKDRVYYVLLSIANLAVSIERAKLLSIGTCLGVKAHVGRWTDDIPEHAGIVFYNMADVPIAFGVTARSTADAKRLDPTGIVAFRQADCGEYVRDEDTLFSSG